METSENYRRNRGFVSSSVDPEFRRFRHEKADEFPCAMGRILYGEAFPKKFRPVFGVTDHIDLFG